MIGPPDILVSQSFPHPNYLQRQKYDTISVTTSLEGVGLNRGYKQAWSVTRRVGWIQGTQIGQGISHRPWTSLDRGTGSAARESPTARMPLAATRSGSPRERSGAPRGFRGPLPRVGMLSLPPPPPLLDRPFEISPDTPQPPLRLFRGRPLGRVWGDESERHRAESQWIVAARPLCNLQYPVPFLS